MSSTRPILLLCALLQFGAPTSCIAEPLELTISTTHTINTPWIHVLKHYFVPEFTRRVEAQTSIDSIHWTEVYGGALSKWKISLETVATGLADIGWVGSIWEPAKMPLQNITYHLPFITDDLQLLVRTYNEIHRDLPAARDAWLAHNLVYLGATGIETYHLLTNFPVRSLADLQGRKILAPGASAVWLSGTGAVPVNGGLTTYYTQLKTGVADGVVSILSGAHPYRIHEVAPYVTLVGIGAQVTGAIAVNRDVYERLPRKAQEILHEVGTAYSEKSAAETLRRYASVIEKLVDDGAIVSSLAPSEKKKWIDGLPHYGREWVERHERNGLPAREMLTQLMNAIRADGAEPMRAWDRNE